MEDADELYPSSGSEEEEEDSEEFREFVGLTDEFQKERFVDEMLYGIPAAESAVLEDFFSQQDQQHEENALDASSPPQIPSVAIPAPPPVSTTPSVEEEDPMDAVRRDLDRKILAKRKTPEQRAKHRAAQDKYRGEVGSERRKAYNERTRAKQASYRRSHAPEVDSARREVYNERARQRYYKRKYPFEGDLLPELAPPADPDDYSAPKTVEASKERKRERNRQAVREFRERRKRGDKPIGRGKARKPRIGQQGFVDSFQSPSGAGGPYLPF